MKSFRVAFVVFLSLFATSITSTVKAQASYNTFVGDGYTVVLINMKIAHGQGGWGIGNSATNGTVNAYVIGGSGDATVDVTFGTKEPRKN